MKPPTPGNKVELSLWVEYVSLTMTTKAIEGERRRRNRKRARRMGKGIQSTRVLHNEIHGKEN